MSEPEAKRDSEWLEARIRGRRGRPAKADKTPDDITEETTIPVDFEAVNESAILTPSAPPVAESSSPLDRQADDVLPLGQRQMVIRHLRRQQGVLHVALGRIKESIDEAEKIVKAVTSQM